MIEFHASNAAFNNLFTKNKTKNKRRHGLYVKVFVTTLWYNVKN